MNVNYISDIILNNFRNYNNKKFQFCNSFNVIVGNNGLGKTNLLEAITMFSNSRGLKNSTVEELTNINRNCPFLPIDILYSLLLNFNNEEKILIIQSKDKKIIKINDEIVKKNSILNTRLKITYLIPQMDTFFIDSSSIRRKFLDKIAEFIFYDHYDMVKKYEFFLKERMKIITTQTIKDKWLDIVERKIANLAVSIANVRNETISLLNKIFIDYTTNFPTGIIEIDGKVEKMLESSKSLNVEEFIMEKMKENRVLDAKTKKTNIGIHKSDLIVFNKEKNMPANLCSTGEQKMLLISLILVRSIFSKQNNVGFPILLLDEICSHIDDDTKNKLFDELKNLNIQTFLTGIKKEDFKYLTNNFIEL